MRAEEILRKIEDIVMLSAASALLEGEWPAAGAGLCKGPPLFFQ